jgi:hypothetical protein
VIELLQKRLEIYKPASAVEEEHAIKEILQETALYALRSVIRIYPAISHSRFTRCSARPT